MHKSSFEWRRIYPTWRNRPPSHACDWAKSSKWNVLEIIKCEGKLKESQNVLIEDELKWWRVYQGKGCTLSSCVAHLVYVSHHSCNMWRVWWRAHLSWRCGTFFVMSIKSQSLNSLYELDLNSSLWMCPSLAIWLFKQESLLIVAHGQRTEGSAQAMKLCIVMLFYGLIERLWRSMVCCISVWMSIITSTRGNCIVAFCFA